MDKRLHDRIGLARHIVSVGCLAVLAACQAIPPAAPPPAPPPPPPAPLPPPPPPPPPVAPEQPWDVAQPAVGDWRYEAAGRDSQASYGPVGAPVVVLRCSRAARQLDLRITGALSGASVPVTIRTSAGTLAWTGVGDGAAVRVQRAASDPGFDWIAFSRGRISVEVAGLPRLILPVWAEMQRVMEDCRG